MALKRCVTQVAPASTAATAWAWVAGVCPSETTTPRATSASTTSRAPGTSGARVTTATPRSRDQPSIAASEGGRSSAAGCAPRFSSDRNGPSRCSPSGTAPRHPSGGPAARASMARSTMPSGVVTIVGSHAVTPNRGSAAPSSHSRSGSPARSIPNPPLHCRSTYPGTTRSPSASMTRASDPTAAAVDEHPVLGGELGLLEGAVDQDASPAHEQTGHRRSLAGAAGQAHCGSVRAGACSEGAAHRGRSRCSYS